MHPDNPLTRLIGWYRSLSTTRLLVIASAIIVGLLLPLLVLKYQECIEKGGRACEYVGTHGGLLRGGR